MGCEQQCALSRGAAAGAAYLEGAAYELHRAPFRSRYEYVHLASCQSSFRPLKSICVQYIRVHKAKRRRPAVNASGAEGDEHVLEQNKKFMMESELG